MSIQCDVRLTHSHGTIHLYNHKGAVRAHFPNGWVLLAGISTIRSLPSIHNKQALRELTRQHRIEIFLGRIKLMTIGKNRLIDRIVGQLLL